MQRWMVLGAGLGLLGLGFLTGIVPGQVKSDDRRPALQKPSEEAKPRRHTSPPEVEQKTPVGKEASSIPWTPHLQRLDKALAQKNVSGAEVAWRDAYVAALRSRRWEGLLDVGDAALRIGEVTGNRRAAEMKARRAYLDAFFRARQQESPDRVLRVAEAFGALGDREVAQQCLRIAQGLVAGSPDAQTEARMRTLRERLTISHVGAQHPYYEP